jgi:hypothetical protein
MATARLGSGTASSGTLLHGNQAWSAVSLTSDVAGNLPVTNLNGGTSASSTTFWRGDGTWATPAGGSSGAGTIGGGIEVYTLTTTTAVQSYTLTTSGGTVGTTKRLFIFDETNNSYWTSNFPSITINIGSPSLYAAGTIIRLRGVRIPQPYGNGPHWSIVSSGATFLGMNSSSTTGTWNITYYQIEMISDGASRWYISPY